MEILIGKDKAPADPFLGLVLKKKVWNADEGKTETWELPVTVNGVYAFE